MSLWSSMEAPSEPQRLSALWSALRRSASTMDSSVWYIGHALILAAGGASACTGGIALQGRWAGGSMEGNGVAR